MNGNSWAVRAFLVFGSLLLGAIAHGQGGDKANADLDKLRQRLASLEQGMSSDQVLKLLGNPDEVRRVPEDHLLDGTQLLGDLPGIGPEAERWAYGVRGKGLFARAGFVSIDRNGKVVAAIATDSYAREGTQRPEQIQAAGDRAVASPAKLSCSAGAVQVHPKDRKTAERFETTIVLKNAGTEPFKLKHDAAKSPARFLLVEVYDSTGLMLFRDDNMRYHSPIRLDPAAWPVLSIDPGKDVSVGLHFSPSHGFGPLPSGEYSLRVYFPFEKGKYYPSNLVGFKVKEDDRMKAEK